MRVISANGTILDLSPGKTVVHPKYPHETKRYIRWKKSKERRMLLFHLLQELL